MNQAAFFTLNQIFYLAVTGNRALESFVGTEIKTIKASYDNAVASMKQNGDEMIKKLEKQLRSGWGLYSYMPPESRGAMIKSIAQVIDQPRNLNNNELRGLAAFSVNELMATTQSVGHLDNTLDRITVAMGETPGRTQGVQAINSVVQGTIFANCVDRCAAELAKASPLMGRPFLRNDDSDFILAQFPLPHSGYTVA